MRLRFEDSGWGGNSWEGWRCGRIGKRLVMNQMEVILFFAQGL